MSDESLRSQVDGLLESDEDQLFAELGIRARAMQADPQVAGSYSPQVTHSAAEMGVLDDVRDFGRRVFKRWNVQAWELVCGTDADDSKDRDDFLGAIGVDKSVATAALATLLVSHLALAPAIAAVAAAIIIKRFARPAYEEFCSSWKGSLPAASGGSEPAAG
ncbi:hypothetical protein [Longimicrobium sp.]|jgi:hypothetical protein|uniref:hypothetical protein n=1 Tax=Longimicrobium sp. TaxID=2029185 RepID=UPI002ED7B06B